MSRLLQGLATLVVARPRTVLLATTLGCLLLALPMMTVPWDLTFTSLIDQDDPRVVRYNEMTARLNLAGRLPLLLEGPEEKLDRAARALVPALKALPEVGSVLLDDLDPWLGWNAPWLVARPLFDDWLKLATHPEDRAAAERLAAGLRALEQKRDVGRPVGVRLVQVQMAHDPLLRPLGKNGFRVIDDTTRAKLAGFGVTGAYTGLAALGQQDQEKVLGKIRWLTPLSLLLVLLILRLVEPGIGRLLGVGGAMVLALGATLGLVGLLTGTITTVESFFGVMVFGLGIDFALHLLVRLREEREGGADLPQALERTYRGTAGGIVAGALTTAGAFFLAAWPDDPVARHLGLSGGVGLLLCLLLMLTFLPALCVILDRPEHRDRARGHSLPAVPWLGHMARHAEVHPWTYLLAAVVVVVVAVAGYGRMRWVTDLTEVFNREVPAVQTMEKIQAHFRLNAGPWIALVDDLEEARRIDTAFEAHPLFAQAHSAADLIAADVDERARLLKLARQDVAEQQQVYRALRHLASEEQQAQLDGLLRLLATLERAQSTGPPTSGNLPAGLRQQLVAPDGRLLVFGYVAEPTVDGRRAREERLAAESIVSGAASASLIVETLLLGDRPWFRTVLLSILGFVLLVLALDLRRPALVVMAVAPVLFGTSVTYGLLCWLGIGFNMMTTVVVPLIIGLGVDDGIHVVHRLREGDRPTTADACGAVGRAILMTTLTTCASFAVMLFTDHAGLESMALVLLIGLPLCLLATVTLVPALAAVLPWRAAGRSEALDGEDA